MKKTLCRILVDYTDIKSTGTYRFRGPRGSVSWPRNPELLAPGGCFNLLQRMGVPATRPTDVTLGNGEPQDSPLTFLILAGQGASRHSESLIERARGGQFSLLLTGTAEALAAATHGSPIRGAWDAGVAVHREGHLRLLAGGGYPSVLRDPTGNWIPGNSLGFVHGDRLNPETASLSPIPGAFSTWRSGDAVILNGNPFAILQRWLQCETDLLPWLNWYRSSVWLDSYMDYLASSIVEAFPKIVRLSKTDYEVPVVVLRHDVDASTSTRFLDFTENRGIPTTYPLLLDKSLRFWLRTLSQRPRTEAALHYDSAYRWSLGARALRRAQGKPTAPIRANAEAVSGDGLNRQIRSAERLGLLPISLHRHLNFIYYPEFVIAMGGLEASRTIAGASSLSRGRVLRYAADGGTLFGSEVPSPLAQVPAWGPIYLWDAASRDLVDVPESTALMEPEPDYLGEIVRSQRRHIPPSIVTACFHPAHNANDTIRDGGTFEWFEAIIRDFEANGARFATFADAFGRFRLTSQDTPTAAGSD